jgi:hypothetical protein
MNRMKQELHWQSDLTVWCVPSLSVWLKILFIVSILAPVVWSGFSPARFRRR